MRARAALTAAAVLLTTGCGAVINGSTRTISVTSSTPGAEVYLNGGLAGKAPFKVVTGNAAEQVVTVHAPGYKDKDVALVPKVKPVPILLDVLWCFTIVGVAAQISDGLLGAFKALEPTEIDVQLEPASSVAATPVREFAYSPGDMVINVPETPAAPPETPSPGASCKTHLDCKGGLVCPTGRCAKAACVADKDCPAGRSCSLEGACVGKGKK